ncbi:MAG: SH3 domain-containing protein [Chloroflexota bacterium]
MALVADENRRHPVARPPWVRQRSHDNEPILAAFMLGLVIVGVAALLMSGQLIKLIAPSGLLTSADSSSPERPLDGAAVRTVTDGDTVRVTLEPATPVPAIASQASAAASDVSEPPPGEISNAPPAVPVVAEAEPPPAEVVATAVPTEPPAPTATPAATATAVPENAALGSAKRVRVVNTDGRGVVLYSAPRKGARQPAGILEGTVVTVLGTSGAEWVQVQADRGRSGWVRAEYLAPAN